MRETSFSFGGSIDAMKRVTAAWVGFCRSMLVEEWVAAVLVNDGLVKERSILGTSLTALLVGLVGKVQIMYATSRLILGEWPYLL
jgi:hypothetical protein